jgi:probable rRNA maturation factor
MWFVILWYNKSLKPMKNAVTNRSCSSKALHYPRLTLQNACPGFRLPPALAKKTIRQACNQLGISDGRSLTIRCVDQAEGQTLNQQFRHKASATNVLSFPGDHFAADDAALAALAHLGDLVLCWPVILAEAQQQRKAPLAHLQHLLVHGFLHLQGFDHEDELSAEKMEQQERCILLCLGVADPYAERRLD